MHTTRSPTYSDKYQRSFWYNWLSWWWALGCSKHVENWNKQIHCVPLATGPGISLINFTTNEDIATKFEEELPHCLRNVTTSQHVLEVATIYVQTGLNPARHILESPCHYVRCHCLNFFYLFIYLFMFVWSTIGTVKGHEIWNKSKINVYKYKDNKWKYTVNMYSISIKTL